MELQPHLRWFLERVERESAKFRSEMLEWRKQQAKINLPEFFGCDPQGWLQHANLYFETHGTPSHLRIPLAQARMKGVAQYWFSFITQVYDSLTWEQFQTVFLQRFNDLENQKPPDKSIRSSISSLTEEIVDSDLNDSPTQNLYSNPLWMEEIVEQQSIESNQMPLDSVLQLSASVAGIGYESDDSFGGDDTIHTQMNPDIKLCSIARARAVDDVDESCSKPEESIGDSLVKGDDYYKGTTKVIDRGEIQQSTHPCRDTDGRAYLNNGDGDKNGLAVNVLPFGFNSHNLNGLGIVFSIELGSNTGQPPNSVFLGPDKKGFNSCIVYVAPHMLFGVQAFSEISIPTSSLTPSPN